MMKFFWEFMFVFLWFWQFLGWLFSGKRREKLQEKQVSFLLYVISSAGSFLLICILFLVDRHFPHYLDVLFWWLWVPIYLCMLLLMAEVRFHIRRRICYWLSFRSNRVRREVLWGFMCLMAVLVSWYAYSIGQMVFIQTAYEPATEHAFAQNSDCCLAVPSMTEEGEWIKWSRAQIPEFNSMGGKIYFQFHGPEEASGYELTLEMLHHGRWYRVKEKEGQADTGKNYGTQEWKTAAQDVLVLNMDAYERIIPGKYQLCMKVELDGKTEEIVTTFLVKLY